MASPTLITTKISSTYNTTNNGDIPFAAFEILEQVLIWASLVLTVVSLIDYLVKNKEVLKEA